VAKQTKWSEVEMTGPAVAGLLLGVGGFFALGPLGAIAAWALGTGALAAYRIAVRK
jgi:hypothetical protein